ncbi:Phosphotyrosyl phosphatase activator [Blastocladiella britannica]|nr:Phosphotyrosyl phosphatase activator [Blastocladiella britannica]
MSAADLGPWLNSEAFVRLAWFLQTVNAAVTHAPCRRARDDDPPAITALVTVLDTLQSLTDQAPPEPQARGRFGNKAFRTYLSLVDAQAPELVNVVLAAAGPDVQSALAADLVAAARVRDELVAYLVDAFGNATRIDYGSGHELAFVMFLGALELLAVLDPTGGMRQHDTDVFQGIGLVVMPRYLELVRHLQRTYNLEPAGSHGVWGLDDFQFVPYYWGSSQLIDHKHIRPSSILDKELVEHFAADYMYLSCIHYIHRTKNGPFFEHSRMLYDISDVPRWAKVNGGMLKMYVAEVLSKFPIVQHIKFGVVFPFAPIAG